VILRTSITRKAAVLVAAGALSTLCAANDARAQPVPAAKTPGPDEETAVTAQLARPRFEIAIGMGVSVDSPGLSDRRTVKVPSFQVQAGIGEGQLGFELRLFSSSADGRYRLANNASEMAVNRLAVDVMLAWRPLRHAYAGDPGRVGRMLASLTVDAGLSAEKVISSQNAVTRRGLVVGAHLDFPLTPVTDASELRVRLIARRLIADQVLVGSIDVSDSSGEAFIALALIL